ncbi:UNKNOWN [Stylonychia lemnae]|uniref:Uncharacterized protein n=1 Tax=Stylonychia lemnae TaxID=5949 RepID=A0A078B5K8_STYLE|nr:UNKNOWN [Stylonychia lemnae]|eukprot:CDW89699.1 UNKNOWN [Stylonychia lemnae]
MGQSPVQYETRTKRFSEYCEQVNELIKKSVTSVAQIIDRDHTPNGTRRMNQHRKSKSRADINEESNQTNKNNYDDQEQASLLKTSLLANINKKQIGNRVELQQISRMYNESSPLKEAGSLTQISFDSDQQPRENSISLINNMSTPRKEGLMSNNYSSQNKKQKISPQSILQNQSDQEISNLEQPQTMLTVPKGIESANTTPTQQNKSNSKTFGLWNINAKLINKQYQDPVPLIALQEKQSSLQAKRICKLQELLQAIIKGQKVRQIMKKEDVNRLRNELRDLEKLQKHNNASQKNTYATRVYKEKKQLFVVLVNEKINGTSSPLRRKTSLFRKTYVPVDTEIIGDKDSQKSLEDLDFDNINEDFNKVILVKSIEKNGMNYNTEKATKAKKNALPVYPKKLDLHQFDLKMVDPLDEHYEITDENDTQRSIPIVSSLSQQNQIKIKEEQWEDQMLTRLKSKSTYEPIDEELINTNVNKARSNIRAQSPNNINQAPSLVNRCKDKYQNIKHKNFLKKRTGHEYDPLKAANSDEKIRPNSQTRLIRPKSQQKEPNSRNKNPEKGAALNHNNLEKFQSINISKIDQSKQLSSINKPLVNQQAQKVQQKQQTQEISNLQHTKLLKQEGDEIFKNSITDPKTTESTNQFSPIKKSQQPKRKSNEFMMKTQQLSPQKAQPQAHNSNQKLVFNLNLEQLKPKQQSGGDREIPVIKKQQSSNTHEEYKTMSKPQLQHTQSVNTSGYVDLALNDSQAAGLGVSVTELPEIVKEKFERLKDLFLKTQNQETIVTKDQVQLQNKFERIIDELTRDFKICLKKKQGR